MKKKPKLIFRVIGICVAVILIIKLLKDKDALASNHTKGAAKITNWNKLKRSKGVELEYEYTSGKTIYKGSHQYHGVTNEEATALIGRILPIIYNPNDPDNHKLLISEDQFHNYNIQIPDSMKIYLDLFK